MIDPSWPIKMACVFFYVIYKIYEMKTNMSLKQKENVYELVRWMEDRLFEFRVRQMRAAPQPAPQLARARTPTRKTCCD
jgi:hypothetical protein